MVKDFPYKEKYLMEDLVNIMRILRSEDGCPWDREQDHNSIKKNFIEETYEVIEAINKNDADGLCEELGDILLQVVFHTQMEEEKSTFTFDDVTDGVCKKLIERHPHVFGDIRAGTPEEVLKNWDDIKRKTKGQVTYTSSMESVPVELPALMRSTKVQEKARKAGFDWKDVNGALDKLKEETSELEDAVNSNDKEHISEELGDLLFSVVNVSRFLKCDAEEALTSATDKFIDRFKLVEKLALERNINMKEAELSDLDRLWDEAKKLDSK